MKYTRNLYSRLTLLTSVTLVTGYGLVYAWTILSSTDAGANKPLTATLMQGIVNNVNDLNTSLTAITGKFGTLTNGKYCTTDGTKIDCTTDGTTGGVGTVIEPRCASWNESVCTIPSCPSGWTDLGINNYAYTAAYGSFGGYRSRYCTSTISYVLIEPRCASLNESVCTIPSCPSGWTDLGINNYAYTAAYGSFGGYRSRYCVK